jgi:GAF domain-containing protein
MSQRLDIVLVRADGNDLPVDIALNTIKIEDEPLVIATLRDATFRRQAEVAVEQEQALLTAINHISIALLEGNDLDDTYRAITHHARRLVKADYAILTIPDGDGSALVMRAVDGDGIAGLEGSAVPLDTSMAGTVIRDREPQLLIDASTDTRMFRAPEWPRDAVPALFVPMHAGNEILGTLTVAHPHDRNVFTVADIARIKTFAAHASVALEDTRRQAAVHRLNVLDEDCQRVADVMHATVIGRVSSASLRLHGLIRDTLAAEATTRLWEAIEELDAAVKAIREAVSPSRRRHEMLRTGRGCS